LADNLNASKDAHANQDTQILARQQIQLARGRQEWLVAAKAARELLDLPGGRKSPNVRQLIELYERAGNDEAALKWIEEWKRLSPGSMRPWLSESAILERAEKFEESISVLRRATQKFPEDSDLFAQLARRYVDNGQTKDAERIFWRQYENSEKLSDRLRWAERLATTAYEHGEFDELIKKFDQRRERNPQSIEPLLSLAQAHRVAGNYDERREALLGAAQLKKDNIFLLREIARMEEAEGDWQKAIETLDETQDWEQLRSFISPHVARFPNDYRLKFLLAIANEELGSTDEARRQFLELVKVNPFVAKLPKQSNLFEQDDATGHK